MDNPRIEAIKTKWSGRTQELVGKAKELWGDLTDDVTAEAEGNFEKFIGKIKQQTGKTEEEILDQLDQ